MLLKNIIIYFYIISYVLGLVGTLPYEFGILLSAYLLTDPNVRKDLGYLNIDVSKSSVNKIIEQFLIELVPEFKQNKNHFNSVEEVVNELVKYQKGINKIKNINFSKTPIGLKMLKDKMKKKLRYASFMESAYVKIEGITRLDKEKGIRDYKNIKKYLNKIIELRLENMKYSLNNEKCITTIVGVKCKDVLEIKENKIVFKKRYKITDLYSATYDEKIKGLNKIVVDQTHVNVILKTTAMKPAIENKIDSIC